jgi:hypothetical protein
MFLYPVAWETENSRRNIFKSRVYIMITFCHTSARYCSWCVKMHNTFCGGSQSPYSGVRLENKASTQ